jgi:hypothetical protein
MLATIPTRADGAGRRHRRRAGGPDPVCDEADLSLVERAGLWRRPVLTPFGFEGLPDSLAAHEVRPQVRLRRPSDHASDQGASPERRAV